MTRQTSFTRQNQNTEIKTLPKKRGKTTRAHCGSSRTTYLELAQSMGLSLYEYLAIPTFLRQGKSINIGR